MNAPFNDETLLARWMSGELTEEERLAVQNHPDFPAWQRILQTVDQWENPGYDQQKAWQQLRQAQTPPSSNKVRRLQPMRWVAAAATLALAILATWFLLPRETTHIAGLGEKQTIELPAASSVTLNADSEIHYQEKNWDAERRVQLQGEAFFSVTKGQPFIVETERGIVQVLGTQFNVFAREESLRVDCFEGKVQVSFPQGNQYTLTAGQAVFLEGNRIKTDSVPPGPQPVWMRGESTYKNTPIVQVLLELERQYAIQIEYLLSPDRPFNGTIPHNDLESALKIVCGSLELRYRYLNDHTIRIEE